LPCRAFVGDGCIVRRRCREGCPSGNAARHASVTYSCSCGGAPSRPYSLRSHLPRRRVPSRSSKNGPPGALDQSGTVRDQHSVARLEFFHYDARRLFVEVKAGLLRLSQFGGLDVRREGSETSNRTFAPLHDQSWTGYRAVPRLLASRVFSEEAVPPHVDLRAHDRTRRGTQVTPSGPNGVSPVARQARRAVGSVAGRSS
jgi:hypothetical protein